MSTLTDMSIGRRQKTVTRYGELLRGTSADDAAQAAILHLQPVNLTMPSNQMRRSSFVHEPASRRLNFAFLLLLVCSGTGIAIDSRRELSQFRHEVWLTENGLPQNTVHSIAQTNDGYVWIGTEEGLALFKSGTVTTFTTKERLISGSIQALFEDADGALWVATPYGLGRFRDGKFANYTVRDGLGSNSVRSIQQDRDGRLWFGTLAGLTSF